MPKPTADTVFELRLYSLRPGRRDTLIELFEREFVESQEALGARIAGTFRVPAEPERFVWLRSFASMQSRASALQAFYTGSVWKAHSREANETMVSVDDVYLLRPTRKPLILPDERPPIGATQIPKTSFAVEVFAISLAAEVERCAAGDPSVLATFVTEEAANNFPALPVREDQVSIVLRRASAGSNTSSCGPSPMREVTLIPTARSLLR